MLRECGGQQEVLRECGRSAALDFGAHRLLLPPTMCVIRGTDNVCLYHIVCITLFVSEGLLSCQLVLVGENVCVGVFVWERERAHKRENGRKGARVLGVESSDV